MNHFNLNNFFNKAFDFSLMYFRRNSTDSAMHGRRSHASEIFNQKQNQDVAPRFQQQQPAAENNLNVLPRALRNLQMNHLASMDRAVYVKNIMKLPKNLSEFLNGVKKEIVQTAEDVQTEVSAKILNANLPNLLKRNVDLKEIAQFIQENGKEAVTKLIMAMASASKQGVSDLSEIETTMKLINACVATAGEKDPSQTLKILILLYLPWLPLHEGVGFELEIETYEKESGESDSSLTIMISTQNYGNIRATLVLLEGSSLSIIINCSDKFPKEDLLKRIKGESQSHSLQTAVSFEQQKMKQDENAPLQAKISMENTSIINPFLLLMAYAIIRHTIEIDRES